MFKKVMTAFVINSAILMPLLAQQPSENPNTRSNPAIATPNQTSEALSTGANSFTESQARSRLEAQGFSSTTELTKDKDGIWRGIATKNGKNFNVGVDYKGNITEK
jgi:periplasmic protein CpxP/Spy